MLYNVRDKHLNNYTTRQVEEIPSEFFTISFIDDVEENQEETIKQNSKESEGNSKKGRLLSKNIK